MVVYCVKDVEGVGFSSQDSVRVPKYYDKTRDY